MLVVIIITESPFKYVIYQSLLLCYLKFSFNMTSDVIEFNHFNISVLFAKICSLS